MAPTAAANHAAWQAERGDFLHRIGCRRRHQAPMRGLFRGCGTIATRTVADAPALAEALAPRHLHVATRPCGPVAALQVVPEDRTVFRRGTASGRDLSELS